MISEDTKTKLLTLADFLETQVKDRQFDFNRWGSDGDVDTPPAEPLSCNTVACAAGWMDQAFPGAGPFWEKDPDYGWYFNHHGKAMIFLGLGFDDFAALFQEDDSCGDMTKACVIARIRSFAENGDLSEWPGDQEWMGGV